MHYFRFIARPVLYLVRIRPKSIAVFVVLCVLIAPLAGYYRYGMNKWRDAQLAVKENHLSEAQTKLDFCLTRWPRWLPPPWETAELHHIAARCARLRGDFEAAERHLNQCIKLEKQATEATQIEFLLMRAQTGEEDEASEALFEYVANKHPESLLILETVAGAFMHGLRFGPARSCLTYWINEAPTQAKPYHYRGWVLERMNDVKGAMADYERALELDPNLVEISLHLGELLVDDNKPIEALAYLEPLHSRFPNRADIRARFGQCLYLQGRTEEARPLLESAVQTLPDDNALLLCLAKIDIARGKPKSAETRLRHALEVDPSDMESQFHLVAALRGQDRKEEAAKELANYEVQKALLLRAHELLSEEAKNPSRDPKPAVEIGALLIRFGQERQGLYWLDRAVDRDPNCQSAHKAYAEYFERKGETKKAEPHRRRLRTAP